MPSFSPLPLAPLRCALLLAALALPARAQVQDAVLVPAAAATGDEVGFAVALSGDRALVGARLDDQASTSNSGAAYVYRDTPTGWVEEATLIPADLAIDDYFGAAVALSGDVAVVGAFLADVPTAADVGAVYVFRRTGTTWTQEAKLTIPAPQINDWFGNAVAVHGDQLIVGARRDDVTTGGASFGNAGSAFVYRNTGTVWALEAQLVASDLGDSDEFGTSVALSRDRAVVGAFSDDDASQGTAGQNNGSAYVFVRSGTTWTEEAKLTPSVPRQDGRFGNAVAIDADRVVVGAYLEDAVDSGGSLVGQSGAAYVFRRGGTVWAEEARLTLADAGSEFGWSVALDADRAVVGVRGYDTPNRNTGAAAFYTRSATGWAESAFVPMPQPNNDTRFGASVALVGDRALVGAMGATVSGAPALSTGAVYVYSGVNPTVQADLFNPSGAAGDGAGWRLLGVPGAGVTVTDLASINLVQGIPAGSDPTTHPAQYPGAPANLFSGYTGTPSTGFRRPGTTASGFAPGRGFYWYLYDRDIAPDFTSLGGGTSQSFELTDFVLRAPTTSPTSRVTVVFGDNDGPGEDDFHMLANPYAEPYATSGLFTNFGTLAGGGAVQVYDTATGTFLILPRGTVVAPWQGFWAELVPNTVGTNVNVLYELSGRRPGATPSFYGRGASGPEIALGLSGTLADGTPVADRAAVLRFRDAAEAGWDVLDLTKLVPPQPNHALVAPVTIRDGAPYALAIDARPLDAGAVPLALTTTDAATLSLAWDVALPDGWAATLRDRATGAETPMAEGASYAFAAAGPVSAEARFEVVVAPTGATDADADAPVALAVSAWPNPTAGPSAVRWAQPESGVARVELIDALGRTVAVLADGPRPAGAARAEVPAGLAPGVYTVRVAAGDAVATRRLTVVR